MANREMSATGGAERRGVVPYMVVRTRKLIR
jgi:hypothetical protein